MLMLIAPVTLAAATLPLRPVLILGGMAAVLSAVLVVVTYKARPGCEEQLAGVLRTHVARLREMGLVADRPHFAAAREDDPSTFVESFWWQSPGAREQAGDNSEVMEIWLRLEDLCVPGGIQTVPLVPLD